MAKGAHGTSKGAYVRTLMMLALALVFPIASWCSTPPSCSSGAGNGTGTGIYFWAVLTLTRELARLWKNEAAFRDAPKLLKLVASAAPRGNGTELDATAAKAISTEQRILPCRVRQMVAYIEGSSTVPFVTQLMELNREGSSLDQEHNAGRFTLTKYILYLLPVIGFIGTVEGISKALMNISKVLPMVNDLDGFMSNLTGVTSALQIAFDSTVACPFPELPLMLVQTLVYRRSEDLLARIDRWVVENVLPRVGVSDPLAAGIAGHRAQIEVLRRDLSCSWAPRCSHSSNRPNAGPPAWLVMSNGSAYRSSSFRRLSQGFSEARSRSHASAASWARSPQRASPSAAAWPTSRGSMLPWETIPIPRSVTSKRSSAASTGPTRPSRPSRIRGPRPTSAPAGRRRSNWPERSAA